MSRKYQDQNYQSGHYQTSSTYPPQQHGHFPHPQPNTHNDRPPSHHAHSSYPEGSLQYPPSGQGYGSRSPSMGTVSFPEPQYNTARPPQSYPPSSQTTPNSSVRTHQHERQGSYGHPPHTGSSSDSRRLYATGGSYTGGGNNFNSQPGVQPHPRGGYTASDMQPHDWDGAEYEERDFRAKGPGGPNVGTHRLSRPCRFPGCNRHVFFDRRVNELREWCSEEHMQAAIDNHVEKPCKICRVWPRRNGYKYCSVDYCRHP